MYTVASSYRTSKLIETKEVSEDLAACPSMKKL